MMLAQLFINRVNSAFNSSETPKSYQITRYRYGRTFFCEDANSDSIFFFSFLKKLNGS